MSDTTREPEKCQWCLGKGASEDYTWNGEDEVRVLSPCEHCAGTGNAGEFILAAELSEMRRRLSRYDRAIELLRDMKYLGTEYSDEYLFNVTAFLAEEPK